MFVFVLVPQKSLWALDRVLHETRTSRPGRSPPRGVPAGCSRACPAPASRWLAPRLEELPALLPRAPAHSHLQGGRLPWTACGRATEGAGGRGLHSLSLQPPHRRPGPPLAPASRRPSRPVSQSPLTAPLHQAGPRGLVLGSWASSRRPSRATLWRPSACHHTALRSISGDPNPRPGHPLGDPSGPSRQCGGTWVACPCRLHWHRWLQLASSFTRCESQPRPGLLCPEPPAAAHLPQSPLALPGGSPDLCLLSPLQARPEPRQILLPLFQSLAMAQRRDPAP